MAAPTTQLPPPPYNTPVTDKSGMMSTAWNRWIQLLFLRVGGLASLSNTGLAQSIPTVLFNQPAPNTNTTLYTSPIGINTVLIQVTVTNNSLVNHAISINIVPLGGIAGPSNLVANGQIVPPKTTIVLPTLANLSIGGGGFINVMADASSVLIVSATGNQVS